MAAITVAGNRHLSQQNGTVGPATLADTILAYVSSRTPSLVPDEDIENVFFEFPKVEDTITSLRKKGWLS